MSPFLTCDLTFALLYRSLEVHFNMFYDGNKKRKKYVYDPIFFPQYLKLEWNPMSFTIFFAMLLKGASKLNEMVWMAQPSPFIRNKSEFQFYCFTIKRNQMSIFL